jgi:hypothetical protein
MMALKFQKIKQILNQGCNIVYRLKMEVNAYKSVVDVWKNYKHNNTLSITTSDRRIIKEIFDFHKTINNHVILYFSSKKENCLLMCKINKCKINNEYINLLIPAVKINRDQKSFVAIYN